MADIRQAGFWLKEGKRMRRPHWFSGLYCARDNFSLRIFCHLKGLPSNDICLTAEDILADDWEIFEWVN